MILERLITSWDWLSNLIYRSLDMTAVEKRAYFHVANGHWFPKNRVYMVEAPIADAISLGVTP